jgi:hypothetical protein
LRHAVQIFPLEYGLFALPVPRRREPNELPGR